MKEKNNNIAAVQPLIKKVRQELTESECDNDDSEVMHIIEKCYFDDKNFAFASPKVSSSIIKRIFYSVRKDLDILEPFIEDPSVSEIMVNGKDSIFIEKDGKLVRTDMTFDTVEELEAVIRRVAAKVRREVNELNPIVDARLEDGSRVNAVHKNIALNGPILTIRKFPEKAITMETMLEYGSITEEAANFLELLVKAGYNCFISGGTSSGKTTFLNVLSNYIPENERVVVIEDSAELQIRHIDNLIRLECRNANVQGKGQITMEQLIKTSLRMRPDRIIVGEVRGREVMDMLQAMNTGHDGSLSTGHGNSINGMLRRLESMFLQAANFPIDAIRSQIAEGIDVIIHMGRFSDGSRKVMEIAEIKGIENGDIITSELFRYNPSEGLKKTENRIFRREKLQLYECMNAC